MIQSRIIMLLTVVVLVTACGSTQSLRPGNALPGIAMIAENSDVLFSWNSDVPIATALRPNTVVEVLAEYDTQYGPVTNEVVAQTRVRPGINGIRLKLTDELNFMPSGDVCLRLAVRKRPIPLRIATFDQSSGGFHYPEWAAVASYGSELKQLKQRGNALSKNIQNFSQVSPEFKKWQQEADIYSAEQCDAISIETEYTRPETAIQGKAKDVAAAEQCVALYNNYPYADLPAVFEIVNGSRKNAAQFEKAKRMQSDFDTHKEKVYFPFSVLPIDSALIYGVYSAKDGLGEEISGLLIEVYQACKTEALTRFDESYNDWLEVTNPEKIEARVEPLRRICRARFENDKERLRKLAQFKDDQAQLQGQIRDLQSQSVRRLPASKSLISNACPAEM